jgi:hypothetical protein
MFRRYPDYDKALIFGTIYNDGGTIDVELYHILAKWAADSFECAEEAIEEMLTIPEEHRGKDFIVFVTAIFTETCTMDGTEHEIEFEVQKVRNLNEVCRLLEGEEFV